MIINEHGPVAMRGAVMRHPYRTFLLMFTAAVLLTGCSTAQSFTLLLEVINKSDGGPIPGVDVKLDSLGVEDQKLDLDYGSPKGTTDAKGQLTKVFLISPYPCDGEYWYLKLIKEGFEPVVIDIKPNPLPKKVDGEIPLNVKVEMKPKVN